MVLVPLAEAKSCVLPLTPGPSCTLLGPPFLLRILIVAIQLQLLLNFALLLSEADVVFGLVHFHHHLLVAFLFLLFHSVLLLRAHYRSTYHFHWVVLLGTRGILSLPRCGLLRLVTVRKDIILHLQTISLGLQFGLRVRCWGLRTHDLMRFRLLGRISRLLNILDVVLRFRMLHQWLGGVLLFQFSLKLTIRFRHFIFIFLSISSCSVIWVELFRTVGRLMVDSIWGQKVFHLINFHSGFVLPQRCPAASLRPLVLSLLKSASSVHFTAQTISLSRLLLLILVLLHLYLLGAGVHVG